MAGGMEGGSAAAELLCGVGSPSGKLSDTFAKKLEDYPSSETFHESVKYVDYKEDIYVATAILRQYRGGIKPSIIRLATVFPTRLSSVR